MGDVKIQIETLKWAITQYDISIDDLVKRYPNINKWLSGEKYPTFKQLFSFSKKTNIPFGFLFLKSPPLIDEMNVEFRTINQKLHASLSKNLRDTLLEMERRKSWMSEYSKKNGFREIEYDISISYDDTPILAAQKLRTYFNLDDFWQDGFKTQYLQFKFLRKIIESKGILVMMNGIVGDNTHRVLDIEEFRAFALNDNYSPLIFINRNDTFGGMIFSIVHEFYHLIIDKNNDDILLEDDTIENERKINSFTAEFLVPSNILSQVFEPEGDLFREVDRLADSFNVSTSVIAIRLYKLGLIDVEMQNKIIRDAKYYFNLSKNQRENQQTGGNYYNTKASRISSRFYISVIHQAETGKIQYTEAFRLLNLKGKTYDRFKSHVYRKSYE